MDIIEKDLPQLIVGLDSLDDTANYIHIADVKENANYYCPCCKGLIKPRAYKKDIDYQVQPHFYHETGGCSEETYIHYICKNWLFEKGCKFIVEDIEYEVDSIEVEKTLHTSFGDYRPDIIIFTSVGKVFYFEIKTTNRKSVLYAPKWDELGNDVVEVDTRYFVNQKYKNDIPKFNLIYSNGQCFIKSYSRSDYENTIAKIKSYWKKRQNKLDYLILWEKLDWFYIYLQEYKIDKSKKSNVLNAFKKLQLYDMGICWDLIFNKLHCFKDLKSEIREIINKEVNDSLNIFVSNLNKKYKNIIIFKSYFHPKEYISISWNFCDEYILPFLCITDSLSIYDNRWIVHPNNFIKISENFYMKEESIIEHIRNIIKVKEFIKNNTFTTNALMILRDYDLYEESTCMLSDFNVQNYMEKLRKTLINKICNYYRKERLLNWFEIKDIIKEYLHKYNIDDFCHFEGFGWNDKQIKIFVKGQLIISIIYRLKGKDEYIEIVGQCKDTIQFSIIDKDIVCKKIEFIFENILKKSEFIILYSDIIDDILNFSNDIWRFSYNYFEKILEINFHYKIPYLNNYIQRVDIKRNIPFDLSKSINLKISNYKDTVKYILDTEIAPVMNNILEKEIFTYNSTHLNSIAYKTSEVKRYDK